MMEDTDSEDAPIDMDLAIVYTGLNETDKVFDFLNSAIDKRIGGLNFINGKFWKEIQDNPRFESILNRMNFPLD